MAGRGFGRRDFLKMLPAAAAVPRLHGARIKITDVRIVPLKMTKDLGSYPDWLGNPRPIRIGGGAFVEVQTDQGITGIGPEMAPAVLSARIRSMWICTRSVCTGFRPARDTAVQPAWRLRCGT
jgi:hypothetical protein